MKYIHFIVNPISGKGHHKITKSFLQHYFSAVHYRIEVDFSEYKKHAIALTQAAVSQKPDAIIACGGDGTINEVASVLVGTDIALGIIPIGSGNGLASNLRISRDIDKAVKTIQKGNCNAIDVGQAGDKYFFSNMGLGIDALIIKKYEASKKRTLIAYLKSSMKSSLEFKPSVCHVYFDSITVKAKPFLLFISNSNEMGYKMSLTPKASLQDGLLDLLVVSEVNFLEKLYLGTLVLLNKPHFFHKYKHHLIRNVVIKYRKKSQLEMQLDGEYHLLESSELTVCVLPRALNVLVD